VTTIQAGLAVAVFAALVWLLMGSIAGSGIPKWIPIVAMLVLYVWTACKDKKE
jgi:hypothetical protein